ncbi:RNA polymerase subunit sigma-24 [Gammaproteobacteria bacterium 45_16_T64]|nr:RNA polymerase subunit sigma-24 [Gammaproteobacteria bacterium 45_16_T64]
MDVGSTLELDYTIIEAARGGDREAMESLLVTSQPDVRRYAMKHCKISDVDDAVQEVLIIIARRLESLRILAAFSSWIFKSVQRECRRLGRAALNFDPYDEAELEQWLQVKSQDQLLCELVDALQKLPTEYRDVILLKDFHQFSLHEIAGELNIGLAAVKSRLRRARVAARSLLLYDNA